MSQTYPWEKAISLSFFTEPDETAHGLESATLSRIYNHGFRSVELSFSHHNYYDVFALHTECGVQECLKKVDAAGLRVWSLHLPYGEELDLSNPALSSECPAAMEKVLDSDKRLLWTCAALGGRVAVIHSSYEPIPKEERSLRLETAGRHLRVLSDYAKGLGLCLAVENLPRTCLGNCSDEMLELLHASDASFQFDTNHSLLENNEQFLSKMLQAGYCPVSLHISDYDFVNERHDLPGHGVNHWNKLLDMLLKAGYQGPALYEIRHIVNKDRIVSLDEMAENIDLLLQGQLG